MKTLADFDDIKLIELKADYFTYCGKKFKQQRFVTDDMRLLITCDDGFDYTLIYRANKDGKAEIFDGAYYNNNRHSYPIYGISDAIKRIKQLNITSEYKLLIHKSQFKR